ncbi:MAG: hypothetical protein ACFFD4_36005 [Candidatus Odinarchaeota archaeon]
MDDQKPLDTVLSEPNKLDLYWLFWSIFWLLFLIANIWGFIVLYVWAMSLAGIELDTIYQGVIYQFLSDIQIDIIAFSCMIIFLMSALLLIIKISKEKTPSSKKDDLMKRDD